MYVKIDLPENPCTYQSNPPTDIRARSVEPTSVTAASMMIVQWQDPIVTGYHTCTVFSMWSLQAVRLKYPLDDSDSDEALSYVAGCDSLNSIGIKTCNATGLVPNRQYKFQARKVCADTKETSPYSEWSSPIWTAYPTALAPTLDLPAFDRNCGSSSMECQ
jgi:hypothetical protein